MNSDELRARANAHVALMEHADVRGMVFLGDGHLSEFRVLVYSYEEAATLLTQARMVIDQQLAELPPLDAQPTLESHRMWTETKSGK